MARKTKRQPDEPAERKSRHVYKIKPFKRDGQTMYDLLQDGDWLESFYTTEAAEAEMEHRKLFDSYRYGG
jgi:hypothetical protein